MSTPVKIGIGVGCAAGAALVIGLFYTLSQGSASTRSGARQGMRMQSSAKLIL
jgi:hypothetical protein